MAVLKKTIFPERIFLDIEKKDGIIAVVFFLFIFLSEFLLFYLVKLSPLYCLIKNSSNSVYKLIYALIMDLPGLIAVLVILRYRKQSISTMGLRRYGLKSSLYIGVSLIIIFWIYYISKKGFSMDLLFNSVFYLVFVGFNEELIFRGFLWPRLVVGYGKLIGTVLSGIFFGMMHLPIDIIFNNKTILDVFIYGKTTNLNIAGGLASALIYIFIYTRNENILLPSFIHGFLDLTNIL